MKGLINLESIWRRSLKGLGLYYIWLFQKERKYPSKEMLAVRALYKTMIPPGSLVFDVGANMGRRVGSFLLLDATVIAMEPNETCIASMQKVYKDWPVTFVQKGVGAEPGKLSFYISSNPLMSSFNQEWIAGMKHKFKDNWDKKVEADVVTLDMLIAEYGQPHFIKIDTEGFELEVLKGLSTTVPYLSFEYTIPEPEEKAAACIKRIHDIYSGKAVFNICRDEAWRMHFTEWQTAEALIALIKSNQFTQPNFGNYGDIYVKRIE
jgi:FkbM family methyltransferase